MTRFRSIIIMDESLRFIEHKNEEEASQLELRMMGNSYESHAYGDINGKAYTVVYYRKQEI